MITADGCLNKRRLQLQGELQSKKDAPRLYKGVFHGVSVILRNEGPRGLFRGIGGAVCFLVDFESSCVTDLWRSTYIK